MGWLDDRVAIVTEGGAGIGEAVVLQLASEGARVVVSGLEHDPIDDVVRTVAVVPGPTETGQTRPEVGPHTPEAAETIVESTIVGRRATVEEIANVCAFLASDEASFVTGVVWVVDDGTGIFRGLPGRLGDIPAPPLTLPVRHSLGGFEHDIGEKPGEAG